MGEVIDVSKGQKKRVLQWLEMFGSITPLDAYREFGIMRLSAVIFVLRKEYEIVTEMEDATNRFGEKVSYARYRLLEKKGEP